ncbi:MAG: lectin like domain-containing protein, partial [Syntrophobacteraceae bacterium]
MEVLPEAFDRRAIGGVTPARPISGCAVCWAYATIGSLESSLLPAENLDLSEDRLQIEGDGICSGGSHASYAAGFFSAWRGPVLESDYSVQTDPTKNPPPRKHVQRVYSLPGNLGLDTYWIKWMIKNVGGVYASVSWTANVDPTYHTYYHTGENSVHAVTLVGWDDNMPADRFSSLTGTKPAGPGAFIAKNNMGPDFADNGFYYISYYDGSIGKTHGYVFTAEPVTNFDRIYQHDDRGANNYMWPRKSANVFTAKATEDLAAVSFFCSREPVDIKVEIHLDPPPGMPVNAVAGPVCTVKTDLPMGGYYTIRLPKTVPLKAGQKFSIVLSGGTLNSPVGIGVEERLPWDTDETAPTATPGESYISYTTGKWQDLTTIEPEANLAIKAFTNSKPTLSISGARRYGLALNRLAWTVTNNSSVRKSVKPAARLYTRTRTGPKQV